MEGSSPEVTSKHHQKQGNKKCHRNIILSPISIVATREPPTSEALPAVAAYVICGLPLHLLDGLAPMHAAPQIEMWEAAALGASMLWGLDPACSKQ